MTMPIIKLEIQHLRESVMHMISAQELELDGHVKAALDRFCSEAAISALINQAVNDALREAITQTVEGFFRYGPGREAIRGPVLERMRAEMDKLKAPKEDGDAPGQSAAPPAGAV